MARFRLVQCLEHRARRPAEHGTQGREALAGAGFDERPANHEVDLALRLAPSDQPAQALA